MSGKKNIITEEVLCAEYEAVYRYVLALCRSEADAQDITQETFLKAMKASRSFAGNSSLYTWLCSIARNLWTDRCRRSRKEGEMPEDVDSGISIEQRIEDKDLSLHIHRKLHQIPEPYREVFTLRIFGQLSFGDIGSLFGRTANWACVTYHRARQKIRDQMEE